MSSPPTSGGKGTIVPIPIPKSAGGAGSGSKVIPDEPLFNPIDENNLSTLVTKSMYSILE